MLLFLNFSLIVSSQPFSAVSISIRSPSCVSFCRSLVVPSSRFFTVPDGMVQGITMRLAVVPVSGGGRLCAVIFVDIG